MPNKVSNARRLEGRRVAGGRHTDIDKLTGRERAGISNTAARPLRTGMNVHYGHRQGTTV